MKNMTDANILAKNKSKQKFPRMGMPNNFDFNLMKVGT